MILRRVIEHVKTQNWFAVFLDFVIVVVGVFIGIQVSNWNASQADRQRAYGYLERIRDDLDADLDGYMNRVRFWSDVMAQGRLALDYAASADADQTADWKILLAYFQASQVGEHIVTDSTYEELKSAGELRLISDPALRDALAYYYVNSNNPVMRQQPLYREHVRAIIPIDIQFYIWENCYRASAEGGQELVDCPAPIESERVRKILDRISNDEALMGELTFWVSSLRIGMAIAENQIDLGLQLRDSVNSALPPDARKVRG
jgi:hypothetical protein